MRKVEPFRILALFGKVRISVKEEYIIAHFNTETNPTKAFWLQFHLHGDGVEWIDAGLPQPTYHEIINKGYLIAYAIDGYFGTTASTAYLNDVIARFLLTFKEYKPTRVEDSRLLRASTSSSSSSSTLSGIYLPKIYKLRELQALKSLNNNKLPRASADKFEDFTFWAIKFHCEDLIKSQGMATAEQLIDFAYSNFEGKEYSTLRAKCRSVWNYYEQRNWNIPVPYKRKCTKEQYMATRKENMNKVNQNRIIKNRNKIKAVIDDIFLQDEIKFKNGKYSAVKIAELSGIERKTVSKYLKEFDLV